MSTACGCTNAVGSTTGTRPSRLYAGIVPPPGVCLRSRASPGEEGAYRGAKLLGAQLRAEDARLGVDPGPDWFGLPAQQAAGLEQRTLRLVRERARQRTSLRED